MVLACITLFQCDECTRIVCLRDDAEWAKFALEWHSGFEFQFCPVCAAKTETLVRRWTDKALGSRTNRVRASCFVDFGRIHKL